MHPRTRRFWLRPAVGIDGDLLWDALEAPFRPSPESLGPFSDLGAAVLAAEPDRVRVRVGVGGEAATVVAIG
jgi:hypothetical protein